MNGTGGRRRALLLGGAVLGLSACARTPGGSLFSPRVEPVRELDAGLPPMPVTLPMPAWPDPARHPEGSLGRVVAETLPESPIVRQALHAVAAASAEVRGAEARRGPDLGAEGRFGGTDSNGREPLRRDGLGGFQGSFTIFDNGAGALRADRARWMVAAAVATLRERLEAVCFNVVEAAMSHERATALAGLADEQVRTFERILSAARVQVGAGISPASDVPEAETRLERVRAARVPVLSAREDAATRMRRVTGRDVLPPTGALGLPLPEGSPEELAELHPSVVSLDAEVRAGIRAVLAADAERLGSVALQFGPSGWMQMFGGQGVWALGSAFLRLSLPLLDGGERSARLRGAAAQLEMALARRRDGALSVAAGIRQARTALEGAEQTALLARREAEAATRLLAAKSSDWRAGVGDLRSVLDAAQARTDALSRAEAARQDARIGRLRLVATAGRLARVLGVEDGAPINLLSEEPFRVATSLLRESGLTRALDELR